MSSGSATPYLCLANQCPIRSAHLENVLFALESLQNGHGSTREEIADYLISVDLMERSLSRGLVAMGLYQGIDEGVIRRSREFGRYQLSHASEPAKSEAMSRG